MQVLRIQQWHGVGRAYKVLQGHGIGRTRSPHACSGGHGSMAARNAACRFRQSLLPLPDLLLHTMGQVLALAFEPRVEHFRLLVAEPRRIAASGRHLCQPSLPVACAAHPDRAPRRRPGESASVGAATPGPAAPVRGLAFSRSVASSIACRRREPVLTRCTASGSASWTHCATAALNASACRSSEPVGPVTPAGWYPAA